MKDFIESIISESLVVQKQTLTENSDTILQAVDLITQALKNGKKVLFFGNGGSAADSQHLAAEFIGRFKKERQALAAIALTTDTSILTCLSNDYTYDIIFARQIEGLAQEGDIAFGLSTSGNSRNVVEGIKKAREMGLKTITMTGGDGGQLAELSDIVIISLSKNTARVQETHICMGHIICELVEGQF